MTLLAMAVATRISSVRRRKNYRLPVVGLAIILYLCTSLGETGG